jgi:hypothetical protein
MPGQTWNMTFILGNVASFKLVVRHTNSTTFQIVWNVPIFTQQYPASYLNTTGVRLNYLWTVPESLGGNALIPSVSGTGVFYYFDAFEDSASLDTVQINTQNGAGFVYSLTTSDCSNVQSPCATCLSSFLSCQSCPYGSVAFTTNYCFSSTQTSSADCSRSPLFSGRDISICPNATRSSTGSK